MNETRTCRDCGCELPIDRFRKTRWGGYTEICNKCIVNKRLAASKSQPPSPAYSDPDFDGQTVGDVFRLMGRAKRWLESRDCTITLSGEYAETKTHKLKY